MLRPKLLILSLAASSSLSYAEDNPDYYATPFQAPELIPSQMDFGGVGLMQMPTGRMAKEGEMTLGYSKNDAYTFYTVSLQLMPWLETTIRYTQVADVLYSEVESFSGDTNYTDKGIDLKVRLLEESRWLPEVSGGIRDIGGTGLFDGEFLAATKRLATNHLGQFDFTLGIGWGYLGQRGNISNPLCTASAGFCNRTSATSGNGGTVDFNRWFHGPASLFGGIEYQTPYRPLVLKLEYDGNDYSADFPVTYSNGTVNLITRSPWNIGAVYRLTDWASLKLSYERGDTVSFGINLSSNFNNAKILSMDEPIPSLGNKQPETIDDVNWDKVNSDLGEIAGYNTEAIYHNNQEVTLVANQSKYRDRDAANERAAAILANNLPKDIQNYKIVETSNKMPMTETDISAWKYKNIAQVNYINPDIKDAVEHKPLTTITGKALYTNSDRFDYGLSPHISQSFGGAESFYLFDVGVNGSATYWLNSHLQLSSSVYLNLADNYDKFNYTASNESANNYRVRTLVREYISDNDLYMNNLQLTWFEKYNSNWYQQFYGGYLESMFAGVGSEILYRRPNSNWALGADINLVSQRDPNSWFGIYSDVHGYSDSTLVLSKATTGHASLYYKPQSEFLKNTLFRLDVGKFLAQDIGARLDVSKQFNTGVIVGAYASKTNMSVEDYGEGSFTKGFYISVPLDIMSVKSSTSRVGFNWQPLTRDGGQKLGIRNSLYSLTDSVSPWYGRPSSVE